MLKLSEKRRQEQEQREKMEALRAAEKQRE